MPVTELVIPVPGPYDLLRSARGPLDLTRRVEGRSLVLALPGPSVATVAKASRELHVRVEGPAPQALLEHVLATDVDLAAFTAAFAGDRRLGGALRDMRGVVPLRTATPAHALVRAVCGQLVRGRDARRFEAGILRAAGCAEVAGLRAPPDVDALRRLSPAALAASGLHPRRAEVLARALRTLDLDALGVLPTPQLVARLRALPGIGPWTAGSVAMEGYGRGDAGLVGDLGLIRLLTVELGREASAEETGELLERYAPWQALASWYLIAGAHAARLPASVRELARLDREV